MKTMCYKWAIIKTAAIAGLIVLVSVTIACSRTEKETKDITTIDIFSGKQMEQKVKDVTFIDTLYSIAINKDSENASEAWCCGFNGCVYYSNDGGKKWEKQETNTKKTLLKIVSLGAKNLLVCGQGGAILRTETGGKEWHLVDTPLNIALMDMSFADGEIGCAIGDQRGVLYTTDGGATWKEGRIEKDSVDNQEEAEDEFNALLDGGGESAEKEFIIYGVSLAGRDVGYAVGEFGVLLKTADGGRTWTENAIDEAEGKSLFSVFAQSPNRVWAVGIDGMMFLSEDGGENWRRIDSSVTKHLFGVKFNGETGYAIGKEGIYLRSTDNGKTWMQSAIWAKFYLQDIEFQGNIGWIVGAHGWIYKSNNNGLSFSVVRSSPAGVVPARMQCRF